MLVCSIEEETKLSCTKLGWRITRRQCDESILLAVFVDFEFFQWLLVESGKLFFGIADGVGDSTFVLPCRDRLALDGCVLLLVYYQTWDSTICNLNI